MLFHKCLSDEQIEVLLYAAGKGAFISGPGLKEYETVCSLVETCHLYRGEDQADRPVFAYYSITKKGHSALVCNSMKDIYSQTSLHPHLVSHVKKTKLDCSQACLPEKIIHEVAEKPGVPGIPDRD